jgi:protein-disulfide isomerase/uncharacterized membrane protein
MGSERRAKRPSGRLAVGTLVLLAIGFATSAYLTNLYVEATEALQGGAGVDSFCNISTGMNCETVAASEYSSFLGIPISVWGLEYFGLAIALVLAAHYRFIPIKRWDSLILALSLLGVPVTILLGWISLSVIQSVCILCLLVYVVNALLVVALAIPNRQRLVPFLKQGPKELIELALDPKHRVTAILAVVIGLSQFLWVPRIFGREAHAANDAKPLLEVGDAKVGTWRGLPASGKTLGPADAPIRIEEFTDFQCPFCSRAHDVMLQVVEKYPGKIHLMHRDYPLDHNCNPAVPEPFHPDACAAAFFARCAADQDLFWPYESLLFHNQRKLKKAAMLSFAEQAGLDLDKMNACVQSETTHKAVLADIEEGMKRGITGTPAFFVNGEAIVGARPIEFWDEKIRSLLHPEPAASSSAALSASPPTSASAPPALPTASAPPASSN